MNRRVRVGLILVGALVVIAVLGPMLTPYDPGQQLDLVRARNLPPSTRHWLGTDFLSRDCLTRVLHALRVSLSIALAAVLLSVTLGAAVGIVAGYARRTIDEVFMRCVDAGLAIPRIFLVLVIVALWEHVGVITLVLMLGLTSWFETSRIVRAEVRSIRRRPYVSAAEALGVGTGRLLVRHVLPNVAAPILVTTALSVGTMVLLEAGLSYLGVGVPQPTPSLGRLISEGTPVLVQAPWISVFPGIVIVMAVLAFNLLADGLQTTLDPRAG
jgi:peptide/nickel transport system permease protein